MVYMCALSVLKEHTKQKKVQLDVSTVQSIPQLNLLEQGVPADATVREIALVLIHLAYTNFYSPMRAWVLFHSWIGNVYSRVCT